MKNEELPALCRTVLHSFFYALVCPVCMRVSKTKVSETLLLLEGGVPEGGGGRKNKY